MFRRFRISSLVTAAAILAGCATAPSSQSPHSSSSARPAINLIYDKMYIRGVFNWWEARADGKLRKGAQGYYVDVELIADEHPYDFKFADENYTPGQSCGAKYQGQPLQLNAPFYMICGADVENIKFTPNSTGTYRFVLNKASKNEIQLYVTKVK